MTDTGLEGRLRRLYEIQIPEHVAVNLNGRVGTAMAMAGAGRGSRAPRFLRRSRAVWAVATAVLLATVAAAPAIRFFHDYGPPYDRIFELSTPIDQSVTYDGYRVTVVRAYGDVFSLRLAITVEDLDDRGWAEIGVGGAIVRDADGLIYRMEGGTGRQPSPESSEGWSRLVPGDQRTDGPRHVMVDIHSIAVRPDPAPTLPNGDVDPDRVWTTVNGAWSFEFDLRFFAAQTAEPGVNATRAGVTVTLEELSVTPAVTVGRLTFDGLPDVPSDLAWDPYMRVEHDGEELDLQMLAPGSVTDRLTFEADPGFLDLSGRWTITIDEFHRDVPDPNSDITTEEESIKGPWVLTFEGPERAAP